MNTYLINIFSLRLLEDELKKITDGKNNIININYDEVGIDNILEECNYFSLLNEEKVVIVKNFKLNAAAKPLEKYLDNPNLNTKLILIVDNLDKRSVIYKKIKDKGYVIQVNELKPSELNNKVNNYCKSLNVQIDYLTLAKLAEYNLNNYDLILNEIDKMALSVNKITLDEVEKYGSKLNGENTFALCDAIVSKDYKKQTLLIDKFISEKNEVVPFVSLLAGQYRNIYAVKVLNESNDAIAKRLDIHPFRVKIAKDRAYLYSNEDLLNILLLLADLDYQLKSLNVNQYILLKNFLMKIA
jgi:DNA polymerase-3 subunit delta